MSRRAMLRGVAVGGAAVPLLAACGSSDSASGDTGSSGSSGGSGATVSTSDVPVGGGMIDGDAKVVFTQPTQGTYKAFTAICTHQGCLVGSVDNDVIRCPCHGSEYSAKDGSVEKGPATEPLAAKAIKVSGDRITLT